ncbi:MAG: hypothetical protein RL065_1047 [Bacteroidota bacterium]
MKYFILIVVLLLSNGLSAQSPITTFEKSHGTQTATLDEAYTFYRQLEKQFPDKIKTDSKFNALPDLGVMQVELNYAEYENGVTILINNAIHPGEPDGVDASMLLAHDYCTGKLKLPKNVRVIIIPVFNVVGCLNRNKFSRANQDGPEEYGFRANGQNLDLNRDFIKCDAHETQGLRTLLLKENVDIFIDNHVSDGADYQHIITLLVSQHNKLEKPLDEFVTNKMIPELYTSMKKDKYDLIPYVNHFSETPEVGWQEFYDSPRFASGFAALFNIIPLVVETHMLKPYKQRVEATYVFLKNAIEYASTHSAEIKSTRKKSEESVMNRSKFYLNWQCDTSKFVMINFKGYAAKHKTSEVSGLPRLYYDRNEPFEKQVKFYNQYKPIDSVETPIAYIIPRGWYSIIEKTFVLGYFKDITNETLKRDTIIEVETYQLENFNTVKIAYEEHYMHSNTKVSKSKKQIQFHAGDYIIKPNANFLKRILVETLEPTAPDSYFNWNFFDAILQQKEGYSDYVFEDVAAEILKNDVALKNQLEEKKKADEIFAKSASQQLDWVYKHSKYYEGKVNQYPVYRLVK